MNEADHYPAAYAIAPAPTGRKPRLPHSSGRPGLCLGLGAGLLLAACASRPPTIPLAEASQPPPAMTATARTQANAVLMRAIGLVGTPYTYGGNTPESGFDCSGLVNYVYRDTLRLHLPRTSRELATHQGARIAPERLRPADLVFFGSRGAVTHVGIYVGEGRFVHAPTSGGTVRLDHLDGPYWRKRYTGAKRVLEENE